MIATAAFFALLPLAAYAAPLSSRQVSGAHLQTSNGLCLVAAGNNNVGDPVIQVACSSLVSSKGLWNYVQNGDNPNGIQVTGTNLCLDAGSTPGNNTPMKVWTCYPGLAQQHWYYTGDLRIAITGGSQCLDSGPSNAEGSAIQTYQCTPGNTNQVFNPAPGSPFTSTTVVSATTTVSATSTPITTQPTSTTGTPPPEATDALHITFNGNPDQCLTVMNGYAAQGSIVNLAACSQSRNGSYDGFQRWFVPKGVSTPIVLASNPTYCLDASTFPGVSGTQLKIWTCNGQPQQQFYFTNDNHIAVTGGTQCVDVVAGSTPINAKPYGSLQSLQTWTCGNDPQQLFSTDVGLNL